MAKAVIAAMPPDLDIDGGYIVRLTAISPTDGSVVSGVIISGVAIQARNQGRPIDELTPVPLLVPNTSLA